MSHCEHCQFFEIIMVKGPTPGDRLIGHCHRFPPTTGKPTLLKAEAKQPNLSNFPLVRASDWCGEFRQTTTLMKRASTPEPKESPKYDMRLVVSVREVARMLDVSERYIHMLSTKGDLPKVKIGARVCYRVETLKAWLAAHDS